MADQATGTVESTDAAGTLAHGSPHMEHNPGRPDVLGRGRDRHRRVHHRRHRVLPAPHWTIFWIGTAVAIVGCLSLLFTKTLNEDWY